MDNVRLRREPNTDSSILLTLYPGAVVEVVESTSDGWSKVKYDGKTGYVKSEFLE